MHNKILRKKYKEIVVLLAVVLVLITINATHRIQYQLRWYDKAVVAVTAPVQYLLTTVIKGAVRSVNNYFFLLDVKDDNRELFHQNSMLKSKVHQLTESEYENTRLKKLLAFRDRLALQMISAAVVSQDSSSTFKTIRIDKGEKDGVRVTMPVVNYDGVVGQIIKSYADYSDVLLITDPNSDIDATDQNDRARGIIEGLGKSDCRLKYLERLDDIRVGDIIITSGMAKRFPKGISIGTVSNVYKRKFGITQEVTVKPSVNFNKIEEVFVVVNSQ
jgi:rod shape-determining protein MreC